MAFLIAGSSTGNPAVGLPAGWPGWFPDGGQVAGPGHLPGWCRVPAVRVQLPVAGGGGLAPGAASSDEVLDQSASDRGHKQSLAGGHRANGFGELSPYNP